MRVHSAIAFVILLAGLSCAPPGGPNVGGPTSDYPFDDPRHFADAGAAAPDRSENEDSFDAAAPSSGAGAQDAASAVAEKCPGDAGADAAGDAGAGNADAAGDADVADAAPDAANADAAASDAGDAQIAADANFSDSGDADGAPADAASDAPYTSADAGPCIP